MSLPFELDSCAMWVTHMTPVPYELHTWYNFSCRDTTPGILFTSNRHNKYHSFSTHVNVGWQVLATNINSQWVVGKHITGALQDISFLQQCCWRIKCSGIWCCYYWASSSSVLNDHGTILFAVKQSKISSWLLHHISRDLNLQSTSVQTIHLYQTVTQQLTLRVIPNTPLFNNNRKLQDNPAFFLKTQRCTINI